MKFNKLKITGCSLGSVMKALGGIDKKVELKQISEKQHNIDSRKVLRKCGIR